MSDSMYRVCWHVTCIRFIFYWSANPANQICLPHTEINRFLFTLKMKGISSYWQISFWLLQKGNVFPKVKLSMRSYSFQFESNQKSISLRIYTQHVGFKSMQRDLTASKRTFVNTILFCWMYQTQKLISLWYVYQREHLQAQSFFVQYNRHKTNFSMIYASNRTFVNTILFCWMQQTHTQFLCNIWNQISYIGFISYVRVIHK